MDPRSDFLGLALVVLMLGIKHGLDADHLAAIDGLTRYNAQARLAGVLFSLGHGLVVVSVALAVATLAQAWRAPHWLASFGAWVLIGVLTLLALLNIGAVLKTPGNETARLLGWRCGVFARLLRARSPATVVAVGALFALSFDTVSQATLFAVSVRARRLHQRLARQHLGVHRAFERRARQARLFVVQVLVQLSRGRMGTEHGVQGVFGQVL